MVGGGAGAKTPVNCTAGVTIWPTKKKEMLSESMKKNVLKSQRVKNLPISGIFFYFRYLRYTR